MKRVKGLIKGNLPSHKTLSVVILFILLNTLLLYACVEESTKGDDVIDDDDQWQYSRDISHVSISGTPTSGTTIGKVDDWQYNNGSIRPVTPPTPPTPRTPPTSNIGKVDDWKYDNRYATAAPTPIATPSIATTTAPMPETSYSWDVSDSAKMSGGGASAGASMYYEESENLGFSVGGAKDINNFRENIENGYLPLPTDVTYEGLFYDYYFDTGDSGDCDSLFCPAYSYAVAGDPFCGVREYYLAVGLNSGMKQSDFERKKLNLVIVLDISGSMDSAFDRYYYDRYGNSVELEGSQKDFSRTKMEIASESVVALLDHLEDDDRFGMVLFNGSAHLAKPLNLVGETDMDAIEDHILALRAEGSTNMEAGIEMATDMYDEYLGYYDESEYENRIIFLTDAQPNTGNTSRYGLLGMTDDNADYGLYTSFIGIGVDFNADLIESITKIKGSNYYSVHSARQFRERMDDEIEFMVTPLEFDLELKLEARGWEIEQVYGSPLADEATGEILRIDTLFPSKTKGGETKGGIVLLKLNKISSNNDLSLVVTYEDRNGRSDIVRTDIDLDRRSPDYFDNDGIRKGVLLSRYADLLINWIIDERQHDDWIEPWHPRVDYEVGICPPPDPYTFLSQWERQSQPLSVSREYERLFEEFADYFEDEMNKIGDDTLEQELDVLELLLDY